MLYDYHQKDASIMNFDLEDLDFKIQKIDKIEEVAAADSLKLLKHKFASIWKKNPEQSLTDTISFKYVKGLLNESIVYQDTLTALYQKSVITAIKVNNYSYELDSKRKRDKAIDEKFDYKETLEEIEKIEQYYNELSKKPDSVLSVKYKATYSLNNPMLNNVKQTFNRVYYTNANQTEFVIEEKDSQEL